MRKIKFRAWDKHDQRMIIDEQDFIPLKVTNKGVLRLNPKHVENLWSIVDVERFEFMQFTGLKDIHGSEIYEGDIVKFMYNSLPEQTEITGPVKFDEYNLSWKFGGYYIEPTPRKTIEVIGHIYEVKETDNQ